MTTDPQTTRYARLRPEKRRHWPECYHRKLHRVVDQADPTVHDAHGYIWIETPGKRAERVGRGL